METALIAAAASIVVGLLSLLGVIITNKQSNNKMLNDQKTNQAVINEQLKHLTEEVKKHNSFGTKIPVMEEQIKVINHRLSDLEGKCNKK